ncbi:MAG: cupin [Candidatus Shapirobacteria bacterium]|nr:cupin [Candidatus Shapirobacteria bacterium]
MNQNIDNYQKYSQKTIKPWGWEILFTPSGLPYTGKIIFIKAGKRLSLQYHDQKQETLCLLEGEGFLHLENEVGNLIKLSMALETGYTICQNQKHRFEATTNSLLVETSTPETGKTYRVEDDYNRKDENLT